MKKQRHPLAAIGVANVHRHFDSTSEQTLKRA
jgi:hypothetical protein